ncbi:flap endonuclease-1 [Natronorarus salvus]|uniref:flap endonuclease-1 n=1 Tax=Natronorarus salvus TaxID=3117733 RepID=UPI002F26DB47
MGNAALRELAAIETVSFDSLRGSTVAIDAHNWLYRYLTTTVKWTSSEAYTTDEGREVANLIGVVKGLPKLYENGLSPVMVFDGAVTDLKAAEVEERRAARKEAEMELERAKEKGDTIAASRLESRTQRLTPTIQETTRELLSLLAVPIVEAPAEGEAQTAHMAKTGVVEYAGTEDYDALLFGSPRTLRGLTSSGDPELMDLERTLSGLDLGLEALIDVGILCGTDFNEGVSGVGPKTALKEIREHGDLWSVLEARGETIENAEAVRDLFLDPPVTDIDVDFDGSPDVGAAREYVAEWGIPEEEVSRGFERIEEATTQTGLDSWT